MATVGDLVAVDPVRLNRLSGVAEATRREVKTRARQWRDKFGASVTGRGPDRRAVSGSGGTSLPDPVSAAELLLAHAGTARAASRRAAGPPAARTRPRTRSVREPERTERGARPSPGPG